MERIYFPSFDGEEISLLLARPEAAEARPCVVFLHGGAWRFGLADSYTRHVEYAVSRGAVGVSVEYRVATEGRTVHHCIGDCAAAMRYLRENAAALGILPDKICVCGESAGGHLALCLGTPAIVADPMARPNYIVNFNGAVDLTGRLNRELFGPCDMQTVQPDEWLEKYRAGAAVSPLLQAGPDNVPVTHMQGLNDEIIFPYETAQLHDRLLACGVESRLILLPGQKHSFILFNYQSPNDTVQKILDMAGEILAEKGFLR